MAFTVTNVAGEVKRLSRGIPTPIGTLGAANQAVAFSISPTTHADSRFLVLTTAGNLSGATPYLEFTLDNGTSWGSVPVRGSDVAVASGADTAASLAGRYDVSGLEGAVFRYGLTALTSGSGLVTAMVN